MKLDTSILANDAKALDTSVLQEDASRNMNPEQMAIAQAQFEEEKPDLSISRLIHGPWDQLKKSVADKARGQNLPEVFNAEHEQEMARISRDDVGIGRPFKPHEIAQIRSDIEDAQSAGADFRTARDTAISKVAAARKEDTQKLLDAMEQNLRPSIPPADEIHAKMLSRYKKSEILESIADSKYLEMDPEFERSSGLIEDVFRGIGQSILPMAFMMVPYIGPLAGSNTMYDQIKGAVYKNLVDQGVDPDRANQAAQFSALAQTPMEFLGDMFILKKILGSRAWTRYIGDIAESMAVEGLTEFAQQYPDDAATLWALHPDLTPQQLWNELTSMRELKEAGYAGLVGALSGGIMTGVGGGAKVALHKYILPSQQKINEEKMTSFLGAVKKQMEGGKLTTQEQELMASVADNLPQEALQRMYYQTAVETENRDKIYDGLLASNLTKEQADATIAILDSIAHHYAEKTGNAPEAFYDTELVNYQVMPFSEFQQGDMREAAQSRTQYQDERVFYQTIEGAPPQKTVKAYKLFRTIKNRPGELFPLFIGKNEGIPLNSWLEAKYIPTKGFAQRPAWHVGAKPMANHLLKKDGTMAEDRVWAEVEIPADVDWQTKANASKTKDIPGEVPTGGHYRFPRPFNQGGEWMIAGSLKVNRILSPEEVKGINEESSIESFKGSMYQIAQNQNPLGATTFTRFGTVISAFEGNNVSTPIHEIGHLLVDLISKYDPQNYAVITKWLGIEPERAAQGIDAWTVEEHERMAKAFETYLMEGKAPNFRTMSIFKSMKKWLLDIYRRVTKLGVKITPEIRAVFDQWLTTEEDKAMDYIMDMANWSDVSSVDAGLLTADDYQTYDDVTAKARSLVAAMVKGTRDRERADNEKQAMAQAEATVSELYPDLKGKERKAAVGEEYNKLLAYIESSDEYQAKNIEDTYKIIEHELKILYAILGTSPVRGKIIGRELKKVEELNEDEIKALKTLASDLERAAKEAFEGGVKQERSVQKDKQQAQREKGIQKAIEAKEKQKAAIAKLKAQYRIKKEKQQTLRRMKKYLKKKDMLYDNRQQLFGLLARYFKVGNYRPDPEMVALEDFLAEKYPPELQAGEIIQAIVEDLPDPRRDASGKSIKKGRWTLDDITKVASLADMIVEIDKTERSQQKLVEQTRRQELIDHLYTANNKQPSFLPDGEILMRPKETWFQKRKKGVKEFISELTRIEFLCQWLDNHESLGLAWERIFKPLSDAENAELRMHDNYDAQLKKIMEPFMKDKTWATEALDVPGTLTRLTRQDMFMIALNSGNKQNLAYLVKGNSAPREVIDQIWNQELTDVEKNAVQKIWALLDSLYPMLNDVNKQLLGVPLKKVEGHYFPIKTNHELSDVARMQNDVQTTKDLGYAPYSMAYPAHGFRKSRAETLSKYPPLLLDVSVIADHIDRSIHDITHSLPVMEVYRTINDQGVKKALRDVAGPEMYDQLLPWLRSISRPRTEAPSSLEKISRRLRKNASIVAMGLKQTVAWLQFTAMTHTVDELGVKATSKGITDFFARPWEMMEFINDKSIMMEHRGRSFDREINMMKADTIGKGGTWSKAQDLFFAQIGIMDLAAAYPTWMAAYNVGQEKFTLPDGSPDEDKIIDYADAVVRRTQGAAAAKDLPNVMKGSDFKKLWTMFYTWGNTLENRLMDLSRRTGIDGITSTQKMMAWAKGLTFLVAIPGYLGMMLYERRLPEDEEWLTWLLAYRLSGIPYIRDISAPLVGYDFKVPMTEAWNAGSKIASDFMKVTGKAMNDEDIPWYNVAKDIGTAAGYWYGLPTSQAFVTLDGIVDLLQEKSNNPLNLLFREPRDKKEAEIY